MAGTEVQIGHIADRTKRSPTADKQGTENCHFGSGGHRFGGCINREATLEFVRKMFRPAKKLVSAFERAKVSFYRQLITGQ